MKTSSAIDHLLGLKCRLAMLPDYDLGDLFAIDAALEALREKQERENIEPLSRGKRMGTTMAVAREYERREWWG